MTSSRTPTRRAAIGLVGAGLTLPLAGLSPAAAQFGPTAGATAAGLPAGLRFRTIAIDTAPMARLGNISGADILAHDLARKMFEVFGDRYAPKDPGGATLVARISSMYLISYVGNRDYGGGRGGGSGSDNIEGVGIVSAGGRVLSETPILTVLDPSYSGAYYLPDIIERRIDSLAYQFAWWLRREMGI